tara:strand:+ start:940 stop:1572 length:633 start_codon:yes stop_codon:yes gene_type:complete
MASIKIIESDRQIKTKINKALAREFDAHLKRVKAPLLNKLKAVVTNALFSSPEIISLQSGVLRFDFGLTADPGPQIVNAVVESLRLVVTPTTGGASGITGGFAVTLQPTDYSNLFSLPVAMQALEIEARIPWLEWLLTAGDAILIAHFGVEYGAGKGRSGGAHMVPLSQAPFGPYKVNSAFSGTIDNNFISRALSRVSSQIKAIIMKALQ